MLRKYIAALWIVLSIVGLTAYFFGYISTDSLKDLISSYPEISFLLYLLVHLLRPIILFPTSVLTGASVIVFGPVIGTIYTYIGELLSASVAFFIARYILVKRKTYKDLVKNHHLENYEELLKTRGTLATFLLRLIPFAPFDLINFAAGASSIRFIPYFLGTVGGIIPGIIVFMLLGYGLEDQNPYLIGAFVLVMVLTIFVGIRLRRNGGLTMIVEKLLHKK